MTGPTESWGGQQGSSKGAGRRERKEAKPERTWLRAEPAMPTAPDWSLRRKFCTQFWIKEMGI